MKKTWWQRLGALFNCNAQPSPKKTLPSRLTLVFSKAADHDRISSFFKPETKHKIDPHNYVVKREHDIFDRAINEGRAAMLLDSDSNELQTLTMAYDVRSPEHNVHIHTELGTTLAQLGGFKTAQIVIAALTLEQWWNKPPFKKIVTEILPENVPSLKAYESLKWEPINNKDLTAELHILCNESISAEDKNRPTIWFEASHLTIATMAQIILDYMDQGYVENKKTGEKIEIDLSAMFETGLSRQHLTAMARGYTNRLVLEQTYDSPEP